MYKKHSYSNQRFILIQYSTINNEATNESLGGEVGTGAPLAN